VAGDPVAVRDLIHGLGPVIRARVRRGLCRNPDATTGLSQDVDEVVQQTLLELFARDARLLRNYDAERGMSLTNYVGQIATREAGRFVRSRTAQKRRGEELAGEDDRTFEHAAAPGQDAEDTLLQQERHRRILATLREALSDESYVVFELLYVQLLSAPEVAELLGCEVGAVYTRRSRIRTTLKNVLADLEGPLPADGV
jgi:RNA polymerase sigma-70 factor (ECF subfamily)